MERNSTSASSTSKSNESTSTMDASNNAASSGARTGQSGSVSKPTTAASTGSGRPGATSSLIVSSRQRGNPVLKHIRNIAWEYGDIVPDYLLGMTSCALFLSLRYHQLNPNYIFERLKQLGRTFDLRVLLVSVDVKDPHSILKDLAKVCLLADCVLVLAFSQQEAARYLETYKSFENKPPDLIMERTEGNAMAQLTDALTKVRSVNKTDVMTLMSAFGSLDQIIEASEEDISLCPGFGPQKAKRLHRVFHEPFLRSKRKTVSENPRTSPAKSSPSKKQKAKSTSLAPGQTNIKELLGQ